MPTSAHSGITVLFATHNGEQTLPRMLRALGQLAPPGRALKIVAVDNASTDATPSLLADAARRLPLTIVHCPQPGKTAALRAGAAHVAGDLVVLTDDDVEPYPEWLQAYEAAADVHPHTGLFGGPITPEPLAQLGPWFDVSSAHHVELFGRCELPEGPINPLGSVFGPNFMLRTEHLDVLDAVPDHLGPRFTARRYPMGQDDQIMAAAVARNIRARGVAAARVKHLVRPHQAELNFMLDRAVRHGRGFAVRRLGARRPSPLLRFWLVVISLPGPLRAASLRKDAPPQARNFERLWRAHWRCGVLMGAAFGPFAP